MNRAFRCLSIVSFCLLILVAIGLNARPQSPSSNSPGVSVQQDSPPAKNEPPSNTEVASKKGFVLEDGTPVKIRINRTVSSAEAHVGDTVDFEVLEDISVGDTIVIGKGSLAFATVTEAQSKRRMARGGKLSINIDYVKLADGEKAALRAVREVKGGGHTGAMTGGIVATGLVFFPAAPFFLFMHGKDITIPKGTEVTAYVNGDMKLELAKFHPEGSSNTTLQATGSQSATQASKSTSAKLQLESTPVGADIQLDGSFAGNTPSDLQVPEGEHEIVVRKSGYKDWQRKLRISAGSAVHLNAQLEIIATQ